MIYLVQVDYSMFHSQNNVPIGLLNVGSALKNSGHDVKILHCTETELPAAADEIARNKPLWVGLSVMTGPQTMHSAWLSKLIRERSEEIPIVWGGPHPSLLPAECLREDYIDIVVVGEGEDTAVELSERLADRKPLADVMGIAYKTAGNGEAKPVVNPRRPFIKDLDADKYRLNFELLDVPRYFICGGRGKYQRMFSYKASRGCPYSCGFCYNNEFNKRKWRAKSAEAVIEDLLYLKNKYSVDAIDFYDDEFYINRSRALKILEAIDLPSKTDIRIDMITEELAPRLKELKVFHLLVGIESGSDRILKKINKGITVDQIKEGVLILAKHDIRCVYSAIIGMPTETTEELNATLDLILWIHSVHKRIIVTVGPYLPYPGTALYNWTIEHGFIPPQRMEDWGSIDRWSKDLRLPWVKSSYYYYIREYMKFFNYNVALLSKVAEFRLKHRLIGLPVDAALINFLYHRAMDDRSLIGKAIRRVHKVVSEV